MTDEEARTRLEAEYRAKAERLEGCVSILQHLIRCMRGEDVDVTGMGLWRIFCDQLDAAMDCRVIAAEQWQEFLELQEKANAKGG